MQASVIVCGLIPVFDRPFVFRAGVCLLLLRGHLQAGIVILGIGHHGHQLKDVRARLFRDDPAQLGGVAFFDDAHIVILTGAGEIDDQCVRGRFLGKSRDRGAQQRHGKDQRNQFLHVLILLFNG